MADLKNLLEQCRSNLKNVHFNIYNAIISGSVELRSLNMHYVFPKLKTQVEGRTKIGEYAYMYDNPGAGGGKYNEPNYDGITCLISLLDDEDFSKNFCLKKVNLAKTEGNWGKGNFTRGWAAYSVALARLFDTATDLSALLSARSDSLTSSSAWHAPLSKVMMVCSFVCSLQFHLLRSFH